MNIKKSYAKTFSIFLSPFLVGTLFFDACQRQNFNLGDFGWPSDEVDEKVYSSIILMKDLYIHI